MRPESTQTIPTTTVATQPVRNAAPYQFAGLIYAYLQKEPSTEETVEAKEAFEPYTKTMGVVIQGYHADNGIFMSRF